MAPTDLSGGRPSAVTNTYWQSGQTSESSRPEQDAEWRKFVQCTKVHKLDPRGLDFDGKVSEIRSSSRPTACCGGRGYAATLFRYLLSSKVFLAVLFLAFHCCLWSPAAFVTLVFVPMVFCGAPFSSSLPCSCFSWGDGATRRTDADTGPYPRYYSLEGSVS